MQKNTKQPDKTTKTPEIYVVLGPTATGKSDFAVDIAKKINGEIISADSRQVYRDMDLGSGKIAKKEYLPMQPGDVYQTYADVSELVKDFDFKPNTTIVEGLGKFAEWYKVYYGEN